MEESEKQPIEVDFKVNMSNTQETEVEKKEDVVTEETSVEETVEQKEDTEVVSEENRVEDESHDEPKTELSREEVFNDLLKDKYQIKAEELDDLVNNRQVRTELPEEVEKYLAYKKETNRGLEDFISLQSDIDSLNEGELMREYYRQTKQGLDDKDIEQLIDLNFGYNEGADETVIKTKKLELKEELYKAKQFLQEQKGKYKTKLESSQSSLPEETKEAVEFFQLYKEKQIEQAKRSESVRQTFEEKTSRLFNDDFKGFEFNLGDEKVVFKPKDVSETRSKQSDLNNFIAKHTDEKGVLLDAKKYHTALSMAMNPEAYAKFFYEQGKASAIDKVVADGKNIDMNVRSNVTSDKGGPKFRIVEDGNYNSGLKINKR
jgi:hypothetical protein